jgi:hypothetical protein
LARGQAFFAAAAAAATRLGVPFGWQLVTVPEADHDNRLMAPVAIPWLLDEAKQAPESHQAPESLPKALPVTGR